MNTERLAYLAGVIDATAILRKREVRDSGLLPSVAVHGIEPVIKLLARATGTQPTTVTRDYHSTQCQEHCPGRHNHRVSVTQRWSLTGARATVALAAIEPFVVIQRREITLLVADGLEQRWTVPPVRGMATLGWPVPELWLPEYLERTQLRSVAG